MATEASERASEQHANRGIAFDPDDWPARAFLSAASGLAVYHRYEVEHLERLLALFDAGRRVVIVGNHALDIVDPLLLLAEVFRRSGRAPHFIGHENGWFKLPVLRDVAARFNVIPAREPERTAAALREGGFLMLFPGGNREAAMRSYRDDPYRLDWAERSGFLRVALEADAEIVFAAAVGIDEAYYQSRLPTPTALLALLNDGDGERYAGARMSFGLLGAHLVPGLLPLPVRIRHVISEPLDLGDRALALRDPARFRRLHRRVVCECQVLLDEAVREREAHTDWLDGRIRRAQTWLQRLGL